MFIPASRHSSLAKDHRGGKAIPTSHVSQMRELWRLEHKRCSKMRQVQFPVQLLHLVSRRRFHRICESTIGIRHSHRCHGVSRDNWNHSRHFEWPRTPMDGVACQRVYPRCSHPLHVERQIDANWGIRPIFEEGLVISYPPLERKEERDLRLASEKPIGEERRDDYLPVRKWTIRSMYFIPVSKAQSFNYR